MAHWTRDFYRCVDTKDPAVAAYFAPDIRSQIGNDAPRVGIDEMFQGLLGQIVLKTSGSTHEFLHVWDVEGGTTIVETNVTYHLLSGRSVTLPAIVVLRRNEKGLISELRLRIDSAPVFEA